jgi:hypothetical protein
MTHPVLTKETLSQDWQHWAATLLHSKFDHGEVLANEPVSPGFRSGDERVGLSSRLL